MVTLHTASEPSSPAQTSRTAHLRRMTLDTLQRAIISAFIAFLLLFLWHHLATFPTTDPAATLAAVWDQRILQGDPGSLVAALVTLPIGFFIATSIAPSTVNVRTPDDEARAVAVHRLEAGVYVASGVAGWFGVHDSIAVVSPGDALLSLGLVVLSAALLSFARVAEPVRVHDIDVAKRKLDEAGRGVVRLRARLERTRYARRQVQVWRLYLVHGAAVGGSTVVVLAGALVMSGYDIWGLRLVAVLLVAVVVGGLSAWGLSGVVNSIADYNRGKRWTWWTGMVLLGLMVLVADWTLALIAPGSDSLGRNVWFVWLLMLPFVPPACWFSVSARALARHQLCREVDMWAKRKDRLESQRADGLWLSVRGYL